MRIFAEHKNEWIIGTSCSFLPAIIAWVIKETASIPDVKIPFWLLIFAATTPFAYLIAKRLLSKQIDIANKSFGVERITIDGKHYVNCKFDGTELVFEGKRPFSFSHDSFSRIRFKAEGHAALTLSAFIAMYSDPSFRFIVDGTFEKIKKEGLDLAQRKG